MEAITGGTPLSAAAAKGPEERGFGDFSDFLRLLTTQLRAQDPLEPMDAKSFTQQLVQYSTVEQAMKANDRIETLIETVRAGQILQAAGFVGQTVRLSGTRVLLPEEGGTSFAYSLPEPAASVRVTFRDRSGRTVAELDGLPTAPGIHTVEWDGTDRLGRRLPAGSYEVRIEAAAPDGRGLQADTTVTGRVDGVRFDGERLMLLVGGQPYPAADVLAVGNTGSSVTTEEETTS